MSCVWLDLLFFWHLAGIPNDSRILRFRQSNHPKKRDW